MLLIDKREISYSCKILFLQIEQICFRLPYLFQSLSAPCADSLFFC